MIKIVLTWEFEGWRWANRFLICKEWSKELGFDTEYPLLVSISPTPQAGFRPFTSYFRDCRDQQELHLGNYKIEDHYCYTIQELAKQAGCVQRGKDGFDCSISGWVKFEQGVFFKETAKEF